MASRVSPTAQLLRKSRLFSLPQNLPPPQLPLFAEAHAFSETATRPYPTHQAIATPPSSAARGDWGLKRALPTKSTIERSSAPVIRVNKLDTFEHITDFESASDHVMTLQKVQELGLALENPKPKQTFRGSHQSVFEKRLDNSADSEADDLLTRQRFRFHGPWIPGMTDSEFQMYVRTIRSRKQGLLGKIRQEMEKERAQKLRQMEVSEGSDHDASSESAKKAAPMTDEEFQERLRVLRSQPDVLGPLIARILDLPPGVPVPSYYMSAPRYNYGISDIASAEYGKYGPPKTHPSAGVSYLRTKAQIYNHPLAGPQATPPPVETRLMKPNRASSNFVAGIAGVVTQDAGVVAATSQNFSNIKDFVQMDPDVPGGSRYHSYVTKSHVASDGSLSLTLTTATAMAKNIHGIQTESPKLPSFTHSKDRNVERLDSPPPRAKGKRPVRLSAFSSKAAEQTTRPVRRGSEDAEDLVGLMRR